MALAEILGGAGLNDLFSGYQRGPAGPPGAPQQLPYGQATALNAQSVGIPMTPEQPQAGGPPMNPGLPASADVQPEEFIPRNERDKALFGATDRPMEPVTAGLNQYGRGAPPEEMRRLVPYLSRVAGLPNAPDVIRMMRDAIVNDINASGG